MPKGDREILKADPDDGFTSIANLLLEALAIVRVTTNERAAVLFLIRRTYGWQVNGNRLKADVIPLSIWAKVLQVNDTARASKILAGLVKKCIVKRQYLGSGRSYIYSVNAFVAEWDKSCLDRQLLSEMKTLALPRMTRVALSRKTTPANMNLASRKEKNEKNIKTNMDNYQGTQIVYKQDGSIDEHGTTIFHQSLWKVMQILRGEIPCLEANKEIYRKELNRLGMEVSNQRNKTGRWQTDAR